MDTDKLKALVESPPQELRKLAFAARQANAARVQAVTKVAQVQQALMEAQTAAVRAQGYEAGMLDALALAAENLAEIERASITPTAK